MAEKRQKKQAAKAFEKEAFSKDKEVTGAKHTEHRQDKTFSAENQFSANEKPVSNLPRDANYGSHTRKEGDKRKHYRQQKQDTSGHNVQKSEAEAEKAFLKENSFMQEDQSEEFDTGSDSTIENKVHVRDTYQRSKEKGKYHKRRAQRQHAHRERAKSENAKQSDYGDFQTKDAIFLQGQAEEFTDKTVQKAFDKSEKNRRKLQKAKDKMPKKRQYEMKRVFDEQTGKAKYVVVPIDVENPYKLDGLRKTAVHKFQTENMYFVHRKIAETEHNVRYIAVNDGVDTLNKSAMDITPFRNILNEMYAADISVKIKSAYRARFQQGKFMGTTAPYGYIKDPADHNHLLIDDKVAHVVKEIFDLALKGNGVAKICRHLNKQHILRPAAYAAERGETGFERHFEGNEDKRYIWSGNSVRSILRSPIYAGNLVGYKRIAANMKSKKRPSKLPEEWEVIPNTHEGIVTQEEFDIVQQLITSRRLPQNKGGFVNIFAGVIKCVDCGCALRAMNVHRRKRPEIIDCVQYSCNNYARNGRSECSAHNIEARDLFNAVLADINCFADMAVNDEKAVRAIEKRLTETDQSRAKALEKERKKLNKRLAELDRLFSSLYEDKVMERITERNFEMMSGKYQKEQLEIEARLKEVTETLNESYEKSRGIRDFLALIRNYQGLKELDATVINALIDKILVSEREKMADGTVKQEIKIYYKFIGFVDELHIIPTKRWAAMPAKNCTVCGVEYVPGSGASRYCPACAKKIRREKSNESKRRSREQKRIACMNCPQKMTD